MAKTDLTYSDIHATVSSMTRAISRDEINPGTGYAVATGTLQAYLVEVIAELPTERRQYWYRTLSDRTREIERRMIMDKLTQKETYE